MHYNRPKRRFIRLQRYKILVKVGAKKKVFESIFFQQESKGQNQAPCISEKPGTWSMERNPCPSAWKQYMLTPLVSSK